MRAWQKMFSDYLAARGDRRALRRGRLLRLHRRQAPLRRGALVPGVARHHPAGGRAPTIPPTPRPCAGSGNRKNDVFAAVLETEGVTPYPGSVAYLDQLLDHRYQGRGGLLLAERPGRARRRRSGRPVRGRRRRCGRRRPGTWRASRRRRHFLFAAEQLGVSAERAVVVEDALSGVAAGHDGDFGLVIGVDRGVGADRLLQAGADVVVADLAELVDAAGRVGDRVRGSSGDTPPAAADPIDRHRFPTEEWRFVENAYGTQGSRGHRDAVRGRQRVPRPARERRGGARDARARHLHQRLPRDLADPARRGGVRLRPGRSDHRQRPRQQDDQAVRRRRAAAARGGRPRVVRARPGLP